MTLFTNETKREKRYCLKGNISAVNLLCAHFDITSAMENRARRYESRQSDWNLKKQN